MVKISNFYFLLLFLLSITTHAQKVSNVTFRQEQSTIIILYDLETKTPCKISLFVSTDDGKTWQGPLKKVSGHVGPKIAFGNHSITWNVLEEFEELRGDKIKFQVKADASNIETVVIGTQEWTIKNLDVSRYRNGDIIPEIKDPNEWSTLKTGAWCYYNNDPENGKVYGKLYNWYAVNDPRGLAPEGFHIPSDNEWRILTDYLGGDEIAGDKMKERGNEHWNSPNNASNSSGFTALSGGYRETKLNFYDIGNFGYWWSLSEFNTTHALSLGLENDHSNTYNVGIHRGYGCPVRCLRN